MNTYRRLAVTVKRIARLGTLQEFGHEIEAPRECGL
jgi:hypothetical protein